MKTTLYSLTEVLSRERPRQSAEVMNKNGKVLINEESKIKGWYERFNEVNLPERTLATR